jgi:hypothetical protein
MAWLPGLFAATQMIVNNGIRQQQEHMRRLEEERKRMDYQRKFEEERRRLYEQMRHW